MQLQDRYIAAKRALFDRAYGNLNSKQREAVYNVSGPLLILAGAGSGKTTVLVKRISHIIKFGTAYTSERIPEGLTEEHVFAALEATGEEFALGAVGSGRGMSCYQLKGGIGSASRVFGPAGRSYVMGALVMTNFGTKVDLMIAGDPVGRRLAGKPESAKGSCIMVLATDAPLSSRQLLRVAHRAQSGLARTGAVTEHGSGEVVLAFSTANRIRTEDERLQPEVMNDSLLDPAFRAATECVEESIIRSLLEAETVTGFAGHSRLSLRDALSELTK